MWIRALLDVAIATMFFVATHSTVVYAQMPITKHFFLVDEQSIVGEADRGARLNFLIYLVPRNQEELQLRHRERDYISQTEMQEKYFPLELIRKVVKQFWE